MTMARSTRVAASMVIAAGICGCGLFVGPEPSPSPPRFRAEIVARPNSGGITGVSYVFATSDQSIVTIRVSNASAGDILDWRLRTGRCAEEDGVTFGTTSAYPVLVADEEGTDRTLATFEVPMSSSGLYRVEVLSRDEPPRILACGDLVLPSAGG